MSVFSSNTLIFAQDTGNAFSEAKISKFLAAGHAPRPPLKLTPSALRRCKAFPSPPSPKLLSPTYNLMENLDILLPKSSTGTKLNDANTVYLCEKSNGVHTGWICARFPYC